MPHPASPAWRLLLLLSGIALMLGTQACAWKSARPSYAMQIPVLQARPIEGLCLANGVLSPCTTLLTSDLETVVREMKACCLALGNDPGACESGLSD